MPGARIGYPPVARALHWTTAVLVLGLLAVGLWMTTLPFGLPKLQAYAWHKWLGLVVLLLTVLRLWCRWRSPPPPLPTGIAPWEQRLAPLVHWCLLVLLLAMPLSGWLMSSAAGVTVVWFGFLPLPDFVPRDQRLSEALRTTHHALSRALMALLVLHIAAVVRHDVLRRDGIFRRMSPFRWNR